MSQTLENQLSYKVPQTGNTSQYRAHAAWKNQGGGLRVNRTRFSIYWALTCARHWEVPGVQSSVPRFSRTLVQGRGIGHPWWLGKEKLAPWGLHPQGMLGALQGKGPFWRSVTPGCCHHPATEITQ